MKIPPEAELAYAITSELDGQLFATATVRSKTMFEIMQESGMMVLQDGYMRKSAMLLEAERKTRSAVKARVAKLSICSCGFPVLADHIGLGTEYEVIPSEKEKLVFICGGCGKKLHGTVSIFVLGRGRSAGGYLPEAIFELVDDAKAFAV